MKLILSALVTMLACSACAGDAELVVSNRVIRESVVRSAAQKADTVEALAKDYLATVEAMAEIIMVGELHKLQATGSLTPETARGEFARMKDEIAKRRREREAQLERVRADQNFTNALRLLDAQGALLGARANANERILQLLNSIEGSTNVDVQ